MKKAKPAPSKPAPITEPESCGTCCSWHDEICKRFPPAKVQGEQYGVHYVFTRATEWCGEWRAK